MEKKRNLWVIPTDKPSRLRIHECGQLFLSVNFIYEINNENKKHIYITSDEEIKDVRPHKNKWQLESGLILNKFPNYLTDLSECKLVIMTTDQDLIKDGVQAIDDEFLEFIVKNPSCEYIKTEIVEYGFDEVPICIYKIIIPKPTQQIIDEDFDGGLTMGQIIPKEETICIQTGLPCGITCFSEEVCNRNFYTEEDVKNAFLDGWQLRDGDLPFPKAKKKWFNEFNKKL